MLVRADLVLKLHHSLSCLQVDDIFEPELFPEITPSFNQDTGADHGADHNSSLHGNGSKLAPLPCELDCVRIVLDAWVVPSARSKIFM